MLKKRKITSNNIFLFSLILVFLGILIISSINIIKWLNDSKSTNNEIIEAQETTEIIEIEDSNNTEIIDNTDIDKDDPYWDYIKMDLIDVDFNKLKEKNNETVGWIQVKGTNINYPFVQTNNNEFYLTHSFDKSYNEAGWVFMNYRNNKNNYVVKLSTETENTLWQVFSVYKILTTNDYIQINFNNKNEFLEFGNKLLNRSTFDFNTTINENDRILTLSTCYDNDYKVVLHAKLIKKENKG